MRLPCDIARCAGEGCIVAATCERFVNYQLDQGSEHMYWMKPDAPWPDCNVRIPIHSDRLEGPDTSGYPPDTATPSLLERTAEEMGVVS